MTLADVEPEALSVAMSLARQVIGTPKEAPVFAEVRRLLDGFRINVDDLDDFMRQFAEAARFDRPHLG